MTARYRIRHALPSGGKAGKGCNKTSTLQVFDNDRGCIVKSIRFTVGTPNAESYKKAHAKAEDLIRQLNGANPPNEEESQSPNR